MVSARRSAKFRVRRAWRSVLSPNLRRCWNGVAVSRSTTRMGAVGATSPCTRERNRALGARDGLTRVAGYTPREIAVVAGAGSCATVSGRSTGELAGAVPRRDGLLMGSVRAAGTAARCPWPARSAAICPGVSTGREETCGVPVPVAGPCPAPRGRTPGTRSCDVVRVSVCTGADALRSSARAACSSVGRGA